MSDQPDQTDPVQPPGADPEAHEPSGDPSGDPSASPPPNRQAGGVKVSSQVDSAQIANFVTTIKNAEQQVGENIIRALQHADTVAVLTTVAMTPDGQQRVVSAALNPSRLQQVQEILMAAEVERQEEEPCVGFHCLVTPRLDSSETPTSDSPTTSGPSATE